MNKMIRRASVFSLLLVLALLGRVTWVQFYEGQALADNKENRRKAIEQYAYPLGDIIVAGEAVTGSKRTTGSDLAYKRTYKEGELYAPVTGYSSQVYGANLLEGVYQDVLDGTSLELGGPMDVLTGKRADPGDVVTTIDPEVQRAAFEALGDTKGAAVALDPATGRVLGMVSTPSYDPSVFSGSGQKDVARWSELGDDPDKPLVNRAIRNPLAPGSTFKLVVAAAALEEGLYSSVDEATKSPSPYKLPDTTRVLENAIATAPCENASLRTALRYSCNNVFAKAAVDLGEDKVRAMSEKFGFNDAEQDIPVRAYESVYPKGMDRPSTALTGIGQFEVTATPLQIAMVSAVIENDGELVEPHMVSQVTDADGNTLEDFTDPATERVLSESTARGLRSAMETVVEEGTGSNARIPGATVGGKTGTAQRGVNNSEKPYAWFTSYGQDPDSGKQVAVAVLIEQSDAARSEVSGNGLAAPIAKAMMAAALK
ncbi:penicillin-binding transpeptidase domain-containing protein [Streptomyces uncialis]|uniref:penicillin-binding transpeptidase domain-containing protein n=1 Tax=Streptomyces uncialis TaxID=1048205 RepID=UPI0033F39621